MVVVRGAVGWGNEIRTELGNEIASEKTGAAKHGRDMPGNCTAPRRTIRNNRRAVGQGVYNTLELRTDKRCGIVSVG